MWVESKTFWCIEHREMNTLKNASEKRHIGRHKKQKKIKVK